MEKTLPALPPTQEKQNLDTNNIQQLSSPEELGLRQPPRPAAASPGWLPGLQSSFLVYLFVGLTLLSRTTSFPTKEMGHMEARERR